jgi:hypothetical protein
MYGCELRALENITIKDICVAWRKGLRRVWGLPYATHNSYLHLISHCLPIFDEICRRSLNLMHACVSRQVKLVAFVALHGLAVARARSPLGQNALFCAQGYRLLLFEILRGTTAYRINCLVNTATSEAQRTTAKFLQELIILRDVKLALNCNLELSDDELSALIVYICTS